MTDFAVASTPAPTQPAPTAPASSAPPRSGDHFNRVLDRVRDQGRPDRSDPRGGGRSAAGSARGPASRGHHPPTGEVREDARNSRSAGSANATRETTDAPADAHSSEEPADDLEASMPQVVESPVSAPTGIGAAPALLVPQPQPQVASGPDCATTDIVAATTTPVTRPVGQAPTPVTGGTADVAHPPVTAAAPSGTAIPDAPDPPNAVAPTTPVASEPPTAPAPETWSSTPALEAKVDNTASVADAAGGAAPAASPAAAAPPAPTGLAPQTSAFIRPDASTATPATVPASPTEAEPWQQVHRALGSLRSFSDGSEQIRVRLHPEELGEVLVEVTAHRGELRISLVTETPAARERLNAELGQLASRLAGSGLHASSLDVGSGDDGGRSGGEREERGADARPGSPVELHLPVSAAGRSTRSGGTGRIDLVL